MYADFRRSRAVFERGKSLARSRFFFNECYGKKMSVSRPLAPAHHCPRRKRPLPPFSYHRTDGTQCNISLQQTLYVTYPPQSRLASRPTHVPAPPHARPHARSPTTNHDPQTPPLSLTSRGTTNKHKQPYYGPRPIPRPLTPCCLPRGRHPRGASLSLSRTRLIADTYWPCSFRAFIVCSGGTKGGRVE